MHRTTRTLLVGLVGLALLGLAACSSSERVGGATVPATDSTIAGGTTTLEAGSTTTAAATTLAPETTVPATPAPTPAPTAAPTPAALLLLGDGIGTASFGDTDDDVLALLTPGFGGIATDSSQTLDVEVGVDTWQSADGEIQYTARIARDVCFTNRLCAVFGGPDSANLVFTGYYVNEEGSPAVVTIEGIHLGDTWGSVLGAITREPGGCYTYGYGTTVDGIEVGMISESEMFNYFDEPSGTFVDGEPDPATVTIVYLAAGDLVISLFADC